MTWLHALFAEHGWWIFFVAVATFVASVVTLPILIVRMPADYFVGDGSGGSWGAHHPLVRVTVRIVKNLAGGLFVAAGIVMLFIPGQGVLTILIELVPHTIGILRQIIDPEAARTDYVFTNTDGRPIEYRKFQEPFVRCLQELRIRRRGYYAAKDTYVTDAVTKGLDPEWIIAQTGVRYDTLKVHYGKYFRAARPDQIQRLTGNLAPELAPDASGDRQAPISSVKKKWRRGN